MPISADAAEPFGLYEPKGLAGLASRLARRCSRSWLQRRWAYFLRSLALRALKGRPVDVVSFGAQDAASSRSAASPTSGSPSRRNISIPPKRALLAAACTAISSSSTSAPAAAAMRCSRPGSAARVRASSRSSRCPRCSTRLVYNIGQSEYLNVKALGCAVLDVDGEATLFVNPVNEGESSTRIVNADAELEPVRVPAKTLLTIAREEGYRAHRRDQARHRGRGGTRARAVLARRAARALAAPHHHGIHAAARRRRRSSGGSPNSAIAKFCAPAKTSPIRTPE